MSILRDVCDALAYAHHNGIVHRDIKLLFDTSPRNPAVFLLVTVVLLVVGLLASVVPAWRAARVNPIEVLRAE